MLFYLYLEFLLIHFTKSVAKNDRLKIERIFLSQIALQVIPELFGNRTPNWRTELYLIFLYKNMCCVEMSWKIIHVKRVTNL